VTRLSDERMLLLSNKCHLFGDYSLENKREYYQNCWVLYCLRYVIIATDITMVSRSSLVY